MRFGLPSIRCRTTIGAHPVPEYPGLSRKPDPLTESEIREVFADQESGTLVLVGGGINSPVVTFGNGQIELSNITMTEAVLTTDLPMGLIPGDYLVVVTEGRTTESIMLTLCTLFALRTRDVEVP